LAQPQPISKSSPPAAKNAPVAKFRLGAVTASIWRNDSFFNVTLTRSYKDGDDWKDTNQLGAGDLENAIHVLKKSVDFITAQQ
jgi:hypothetical protein